jgi:hypothetical protein
VRAIDDRLVAADDDPPTLERRLAIAAERDRLKAAGGRVPACTRSEGGTSPGARATSTVAADRSSAANSRRSPRPSRQR